ncbi:MAG: 2-oxoglutarate dehydrogenase complex dihydrolipoyllysine-residue succinyltransferase [Chloroflexi bacterium]|nr:2-oxoglutarate dehydrogenase complex dihydrolipoyllysine-residue succinyltransferase [Chloroflexota bacterium]
MSVEIKVPQMAESVVEATVGTWLKSVGEAVSPGEVVLELETDKVNLEVTAETAGVLEKIVANTGDTVVVGDLLGTVAEGAAPATAAATQAATAAPAAQAKVTDSADSSQNATPVAKRLAAAKGVDLSSVTGTGPHGKITKEDVESIGAPAPTPKPVPAVTTRSDRSEERVRLSRRRLTIAQRMADVQREAVMTTTYNEADMTNIMALRSKFRDQFKEKHGVSLGFMSFFVKAVVEGLKFQRVINSELQGEELVYKNYYDIGVAVSTDDGLVVPVVRDADHKSFAEIETDIRGLAGRARDKKLTLDELRGATFTITNGGVFGSMFSTPILNPPQVAILGMHAIKERAVVVNGKIEARPMMYLAVTYDHRVVEGADSVQFLVKVKEMIEDPERMMIGV